MKSITLIISGSIAAVKAPELIRQLKRQNIGVRCIVTKSGEEFVSLAEIEKLSGHPVSTDLFSSKEKEEMWHIRSSRETDLIVVAPASADLIAKMAHGFASDMASATLLANNKKLLVAPAMNTYMWVHPATQRNVRQIIADGAEIIEPGVGMLACGEAGAGRMAEPEEIVKAVLRCLKNPLPLLGGGQGGGYTRAADNPHLNPPPKRGRKLKGIRVLVTSGPTYEAIDPVRFIGNRSSGKQGHAIAKALAEQGAQVTLISGPTSLPDPLNVKTIRVTSAAEMLKACEKSLPVDVAICAAAVSDWKVKAPAKQKIKKSGKAPTLSLVENPDILFQLSRKSPKRPKLVIGFAAETEKLAARAAEKLRKKGCDWILANDVSKGKGFDSDENRILFVTAKCKEQWPRMSKQEIAERLVEKITDNRHSRTGGNLRRSTEN